MRPDSEAATILVLQVQDISTDGTMLTKENFNSSASISCTRQHQDFTHLFYSMMYKQNKIMAYHLYRNIVQYVSLK